MLDKYKKVVEYIRNEWAADGHFVPLHEPVFNGNEKKYLNETIDSGYVSSVGEFVNRFEKEFAAYIGADYAVAAVNGTAAMHAALVVAGVKRGDEVITQALTFIATANSICYAGAKPVFVDVEPGMPTLSAKVLEDFLNEFAVVKDDGFCYNKQTGNKISACVPVHVFGMVADMQGILKVCNMYRIPVVEDAAESLGSTINGVHSGLDGLISAFSFNGNKIVTSGGGGAIVTNNPELASLAKHITTTAKVAHPWNYTHDMIGFNYRMPNINAALMCAQMEQLDGFLEKKRRVASCYHELFHNLEIDFIKAKEGQLPNNWLNNMLLSDRQERDEFLEYSNSNGIMSRPLWTMMKDMEIYQNCLSSDLTNSKWLMDRVVNLPSSANLI